MLKKVRIFLPAIKGVSTYDMQTLLPQGFNAVEDRIFSGEGRCFREMAQSFGLEIHETHEIFGCGERLVMESGQRIVIQNDGRRISEDQFFVFEQGVVLDHLAIRICGRDVILGSWGLLRSLGQPDALPGSVWDLEISREREIINLKNVVWIE